MPPIADGSRATMPARMIMEMPLPMPRSVICSPSHIRNMVPVVMVTVADQQELRAAHQRHAALLQRAGGGERLHHGEDSEP